jgi:carbonic anhydrase
MKNFARYTAIIVCSLLFLYSCNDNSGTANNNSSGATAAKMDTAAQKDTVKCKDCCCSGCVNQSPVDIVKSALVTSDTMKPIDGHWTRIEVDTSMSDDYGHKNIEMKPKNKEPENGNFVMFNGVRYNFFKFHFHSTSEHAIESIHDSMEMHVVFKKPNDTALLIIGLMIETGTSENVAIKELWNNITKQPAASFYVDLGQFINPRMFSRYYTYPGSLTVPCYREGATWFVLKDKIKVSPRQLEQFKSWHVGSARELQPINSRKIYQTAK